MIRVPVPLPIILLCFSMPASFGQTPPAQRADVVFNGEKLFTISTSLGPVSAEDRARAVEDRLIRIARHSSADVRKADIVARSTATDLFVGGVLVTTVTDADAAVAGRGREELAREEAGRIRDAIERYRAERSMRYLLAGAGFALLSTLALVAALWLIGRLYQLARRALRAFHGAHIRSVRIQELELLPAGRILDILLLVLALARVTGTGILLYLYLILVFSFFPWTRNFAPVLLDSVLAPVKHVFAAIISWMPNLLFVLVIGIVTRYALKLVYMIFQAIESGTITFAGFYQEWAQPTYKVARLLVLALAAVAAYPYIPGSQSPAFKAISVFAGVLVSLGSAGAVANVVAGTSLTYMRSFQKGDLVQIGDVIGVVVEQSLLITRLHTIKNVLVSVPNSLVLSHEMINYSSLAETEGLILHTAVTIGYDAPWRTVHKLLLDAALATEGLLSDPAPFVHQTKLNDFYIEYEINAYTRTPRRMGHIYSELHQNIQDQFNTAGVEIMSPHYSAIRDGNRIAIPDEYLPSGYVPGSFRVTRATADGRPQPLTTEAT